MEFKLARKEKVKLVKELIRVPERFYGSDDNNIIDLLDHVFDLRGLASEDSRFDDAYGDAVQHLINNDDWELEYTLFTRFDILSDDKLGLLIEYMVKPDFLTVEQVRLNLIDEINSHLRPNNYFLEISHFDEDEKPIYRIELGTGSKYPAGVIKNEIKFFTNYTETFFNKIHEKENDIFILNFKAHDWWNDYSLNSKCDLIYRDENGKNQNLGVLKVISSSHDNYSERVDENNRYINFHTILPDIFTELDDSYCSLGQGRDYYLNLKESFGKKFRSILYALKDAAFFSDIEDHFEKDYYFKNSLIRKDKAERLLREIKFELSGVKRQDMYRFDYLFSPIFGKDDDIPPNQISFNFEDVSDIPNRICAIIGKNGVGKTQFISKLPQSLTERIVKDFEGSIPTFSKIIALSYSPFDNFKPSQSSADTDYIFCSLRNDSGDLGDSRSRAIKFGLARKRIQTLGRSLQWMTILKNFLPESFIAEAFYFDAWGAPNEVNVNIDKLNSNRKSLSSGQRILLEAVTNIIAYIRFDSLLLFDEPETHLHPNAIAQLMNTIYNLVNQFKSFCIITTHSPIIVRELLSRNVFVFDREHDHLSIRKIGMESFGANLSDITEEVFGTNEIPKHYKGIIKQLQSNGRSEQDILNSIKSDDVPLSLNLRLYIRSIFSEIK